MRPVLREALVVEGRYDKNTVSQVLDALILETRGFGVFTDPELVALLRTLARTRGLVILTDSDSAGFLIRNHLRGALAGENVKHAYIPDIPGKERRKSAPSREGKLGVEGVPGAVILDALRRAGAVFENESAENESARHARGGITKTDLYALGLTGTAGSDARRAALKKKLGLPERLSANALLEVLNALMTPEELAALTRDGPPE